MLHRPRLLDKGPLCLRHAHPPAGPPRPKTGLPARRDGKARDRPYTSQNGLARYLEACVRFTLPLAETQGERHLQVAVTVSLRVTVAPVVFVGGV
jgi:hypothetical protein